MQQRQPHPHRAPWRIAVYLCVLLALAGSCQSAVLIADYSMSRMIELIAKRPFCKLHTDR